VSVPSRGPASGFRYLAAGQNPSQTGSVLHCDQMPLRRLAERFGTPLYVYSAGVIRSRVRDFEQAFRAVLHTLCYSVKANSNLGILRLLKQTGCGFDIVSGGELQRVLRAAPSAAKKVVFSGVGKTSQEIEQALKAGILLFNVESESELHLLASCAARVNKAAPVALRVNPDVPADTHPYISTGLHQHKFGIPVAHALGLYRQASQDKHLRTAGVSVHIGSQITDVRPFARAMETVADLVRELRMQGHAIRYVDAGGGLGIDYERESDSHFAEWARTYAQSVLPPLQGLDLHLLLEPGRSIVGPAGVLITKVLYRKQNNGKKFLIVDAAMNDLLRPTLYRAYHRIAAVCSKGGSTEKADVVGPICESGDYFAQDRELPAVEAGELLAIMDVGAYGMGLASNYNSRPRPAEVLVDKKSVRVIRRRETLADLLRPES
jgi:diaminopimelate decarboxylase